MHASRSHLLTFVALSLVAGGMLSARPALAQERGRLLAAPAPYGTIPPWTAGSTVVSLAPTPPAPSYGVWDPSYAMRTAQARAAPGGARVLRAAQQMIDSNTIVRGSCYDWVEAVFTRASGQRHAVWHGGPQRGPYAQSSDFRPGDWVMFVNEMFGGDRSHTHSAIFVGWVDESTHEAMMISYPGGRRDEPGRYSSYDLSMAYRIERMDDALPPPPAHRAHRPSASGRATHHSRHRAHG